VTPPFSRENALLLVVTPTLGASRFLRDTMASVAAIGCPLIHVLACPAERVASLQMENPQCRVVPDAGREAAIYGALNAALAAIPAGWEWFTYINDDDALGPDFGDTMRRHLARATPEPVTYGDVRVIDEEGRTIGLMTNERSPRFVPAVLRAGISPLNQQGMLFSREVLASLGGFDTRYRICADLDLWARAMAEGCRFRYYRAEVGRFRIRRGQISGDVAATRREQEEIAGRAFPRAGSWTRRSFARWRYRMLNLPRYLARGRSVGWVNSGEILAEGRQVSRR
jgi:hypothetical protein